MGKGIYYKEQQMKILIVGNTGFIGGFLTQRLIDNSHQVIGLDVKLPKSGENSYQFMQGSVLNTADIMKAASGADAIISLAAKHHDFGVSQDDFFRVNVQGTKNILDCASRLGIKKFIFYSTVAVYGNHKAYTTEETKPEPISDYGKSKLVAEEEVQKWVAKDTSRRVVIIRPTVVFGPNNYANMYNLINSIYKKRFIFVGKGDNIKSVAYVENLVDATIYLLERLKPGVDIYNYSDYPQMSISETVKTITKFLPCNMPKLRLPLKPVLITASMFDWAGKLTGYNFPITANRIKKFNTATHHKADKIRILGFQQRVGLIEGFRRMIKWYLNNNGETAYG